MITLLAPANLTGHISTNYLLNISYRMLADNAPDLKAIKVLRTGMAFQNKDLQVILRRDATGKITEEWGFTEAVECPPNIT